MSISLSRARKLYLAAGVIWGVICGFVVAYVVGGGATGIFWIFIFGDNAWPDWAWAVINTLMITTGFPVFGACVYIGWKYAKQIKTQGSRQTVNTKQALFPFVSSIAVLLVFALYRVHIERSKQAPEKSTSERYQQHLEDISPTRKPNETDIEYYCRIIRKQSKIGVMYRGELAKIVPEGLANTDNETVLFAVVGPYDTVKAMGEEMVTYKGGLSSGEVLKYA